MPLKGGGDVRERRGRSRLDREVPLQTGGTLFHRFELIGQETLARAGVGVAPGDVCPGRQGEQEARCGQRGRYSGRGEGPGAGLARRHVRRGAGAKGASLRW